MALQRANRKVEKKVATPVKKTIKKVSPKSKKEEIMEEDIDEIEDDIDEEEEEVVKKPVKKIIRKPAKKVIEEDEDDTEEDIEEDEDEDDTEEDIEEDEDDTEEDIEEDEDDTEEDIEEDEDDTEEDIEEDEDDTNSNKLNFIASVSPEKIPENSSVTIEIIKSIMANKITDVLNNSTLNKTKNGDYQISLVIADRIIKSYEETIKEILEKKSTFTFIGKKYKRTIVNGRIFANSAIGGEPVFIPPHVEMKLPVYFDSSYKDDKVVLTEKNGKFFYKEGKKTIELTDDLINTMNEEFASQFSNTETSKKKAPVKKTTTKKTVKKIAKKK